MSETLMELRVCPKCGQDRPLLDFKRRSIKQGGGFTWCRSCVNTAARERTRRKRNGIVRGLGRHIRDHTGASRVEAVVAAATRRLGGVEAVGAEVARLFKDAVKSKSHRDRWAAGLLFFRLATAAEELKHRREAHDCGRG